MTPLEFRFEKKFGEKRLSAQGTISFTKINPIVALMGPSGAGKTTLSRWIVGLESADSGYLKFSDQLWCDTQSNLAQPMHARHVGMLSQKDSLFPHLTVAENIGYGLRYLSKSERVERIDRLMKMISLESSANRKPNSLSGGEKRRVALAQMLAIKPNLLILDEPLTGLDEVTKSKLIVDLKKWLLDAAIPTILITHDKSEAQSLASSIHSYNDSTLILRS